MENQQPTQPTPGGPLNPSEGSGERPKDVLAPQPAPAPAPAPIDIASILLPKKEVPGTTVASAQRVNAGALMEQEQHATLLSDVPKPPPAPPAPPPAPPANDVTGEKPEVQPIQTYQRDIEDLVKDKNVSILSIAAAEAERRGSLEQSAPPATGKLVFLPSMALLKQVGMYALGFLLLVGASGTLAYIVMRPTFVNIPQVVSNTPFITVDDTKVITISADTSRSSLISTLTAAKQATALSVGLMSQLLVTVASSTSAGQALDPISAQSFFSIIAPNMPQGLQRSIRPSYLLGVHVYNNNQPFLVMSVDSYEQAYAGMVAWEGTMQQDLAPLFSYTPSPHIPEQGVATTSTSSSAQFIQTGFVDKIVENHDARVIQNDTGDVSLLWTFLDRNTLVVTTNDATLREIISRLKQAPVTPIPGQ